jgi:hypothetical protein
MHNRAVTVSAVSALRYLLLSATAAMFLLHLATAPLLRRGVRGVTLLRFEIAYYVLLLAALAVPQFRRVMVPAIVLAALHLAAWIYSEIHHEKGVPRPGVLRAVQIFDTGEAAVLAWIAFLLF